jgi:Short C-terminal domain
MQPLTPAGEQAVQDLAQRYRVSTDSVKTLLSAVAAGGGTMAQFYIPELGGGGQWMRGGMTMVGDMFNSGLQATVSGLCAELSSLLGSQQVFVPLPPPQAGGGFMASGNAWWPGDLGNPSSSGGQNNARYAYFPQSQRLAIDRGGQVTVYNTLDHQIGGVQQQQGGAYGSLSFSSQYGTFTVDSLPVVSPAPPSPPSPPPPASNWQTQPSNVFSPQAARSSSSGAPQSHDEILSALERLGTLHEKGILSDQEFQAKKAELLSRL